MDEEREREYITPPQQPHDTLPSRPSCASLELADPATLPLVHADPAELLLEIEPEQLVPRTSPVDDPSTD